MIEPLSVAEVLTKQFYDWELRGRGWQVWESPVELEPPFRPFTGHHLPPDFFHDDGQLESPLSRWTTGLFGKSTAAPPVSGEPPPAEQEPAPDFIETLPELIELQVALPPASQPKPEVFEQLLASLHYCRQPLAFEVVGTAESMVMQVVAERSDVGQVAPQLFQQVDQFGDFLFGQQINLHFEMCPPFLEPGQAALLDQNHRSRK